mmetsp:Transcript_72359/g.203119  ORF Transcript_72359/g.203119 Transcript_72359/m.203119 type:complete len:391 (+) Transcript_72359:108-1280(+)
MACWRGVCRFLRCRAVGRCEDEESLPIGRSLSGLADLGRSDPSTVHDPQVLEPQHLRRRRASKTTEVLTEHFQRDLQGRCLVRREASTLGDHYAVAERWLGRGSFSVVRMASCNATGLNRAVKVITKDVKDAPNFKTEIDLLTALDHENIIQLLETFEDPRRYYIVMELCMGGELFERIVDVGGLTEPQAAVLMRQIARTICYLHGEGVVHRDLKPDNFVFATKGPLESTALKLIDFGLSRRFSPGEVLTTAVGTVLYVAPEVFGQAYSPACDLWSFGVIVYVVLCGYPPFDGQTAKQVVKCIRKGSFSCDGPQWSGISDDAKDLVRNLVAKDPALRLSGPQALAHPWIEGLAAGSGGGPLDPAVLENLRELGAQNRQAKSLQRRRSMSF